MRRIELFEEEGLFFIRHHLPNGNKFDQVYECEVEFLSSLASFIYLSSPMKLGIDIEVGVASTVMPFLEGLVGPSPSEKRSREAGVRG